MLHKLYYKLTLIALIAQIILHLLIQILSLLLVLEIRDEALDGFDYIGLGEIIFVEDGFEVIKESVDLVHVMASSLFYDTESQETLHVYLLAGNVELFVGFLTGSV